MSKMKQTTHQLMEALPWKRMRNCFGAGRPCNRECVDPAEEMALYVFGRTRIDVSIPFAEKGDDCMVYVIKISIGEVWWTVKHRYKEFDALHTQLVLNHGLRKDLLPAKKIIGNKDPEFIERRREDLEVYIKKIVQFLEKALPLEVCSFLEFEEYEVYSIIRKMAAEVYTTGETKLMTEKSLSMNPLQLHAISQKIQLPRSPVEQLSVEDFAHVLDFLSNIESLEVVGDRDFYLNSNLILNSLPYELTVFKQLKHLRFSGANVASLACARHLRAGVETLSAQHCGLKSIADLLICDNVHKTFDSKVSSPFVWRRLTSLDVSRNAIESVDASLASLAPQLRRLDVSHNRLTGLASLSSLSSLEELSLAHNLIEQLRDLHTKLGNVKNLNVAANQLRRLDGLAKLYGLVRLDAGGNRVADVESVRAVAQLPCLEALTLTANPVTSVVDFRTKVLTMFRGRCAEVCLDNEPPTQKELDTVAVLLALESAKKFHLPK